MEKQLHEFQNYIWDWNGTIINDLDFCLKIANEIMKNHRDEEVTVQEYRAVFGFPVIDYWKRLGFDFNKESFEELTVKFMAQYNEKVLDNELQEGARDVLDSLNRNGKSNYVLTAAHQKDVLQLLDKMELQDSFVSVHGLDNYRAESKVQNGIKLMQQYDFDPEQTVMMGDTIHDYEVAREMGIYSVLIPNGHQSEERLRAIPDKRQRVVMDIREFLV